MLLILKNFSKFFSFINIISGYICAFLVFLMFVNVFGVVVLRYLFDISFIWMQETYVWMHAIIFMVASGYTYLYDEHVRIDIIYRDASLKYKRIVNFIGHICFLLPFMYFIWFFSFPFVYRSWAMGEVSREAGGLGMVYLLKSSILIFVILLTLQIISKLINEILGILNYDSR